MFYREAGNFQTHYRADQQTFPLAVDRWTVRAVVAFAFLDKAFHNAI